MIFVGTGSKSLKELSKKLASRVPGLFRSNSPVIMPIEYSTIIETKLDSHVIFYTKEKDETYRLTDKFSVKGGTPIILELGTWEDGQGVSLKKKMNRWDRRTDLLGTPFANALDKTKLVYDKNGNITGSKGRFLTSVLFYITNRLNLTVKYIEVATTGKCWTTLDRNKADVCSNEMRCQFQIGQCPFSVLLPTDTLFAGVRTGTAPDAWVFIEVFGFWQWFAILSSLAVIAMVWPIIHFTLEKKNQRPPLYEGLVTVALFSIQNGNQPDSKFWTRRILALTTSMMTLVVFVYYCNDITSKMTAGPPPINVHSFDDALDQGYEVIVVGKYHWRLLKNSENGTSKNAVYKRYFEEYENDILEYILWTHGRTAEEIRAGVKYGKIDKVPKWFFDNTEQNLDLAAERIINDKKVLWFCHSSVQNWNNSQGKVFSLKMEDSITTYAGFALQKDSEFMAIFNHYLLKAHETGILNRLALLHPKLSNQTFEPGIIIGLNEPEPLGIDNLMFPFSFLAASIVTSFAIAIMEKMISIVCPKGGDISGDGPLANDTLTREQLQMELQIQMAKIRYLTTEMEAKSDSLLLIEEENNRIEEENNRLVTIIEEFRSEARQGKDLMVELH